MKRSGGAVKVLLMGLLVFAFFFLGVGQAKADTYQVHLFNTDDAMNALLTNSSFSSPGLLVASSTFAVDNTTTDITSFVTPGTNTLDFYLTNNGGGYTWGIEVFQDSSTLLHSSVCGTKNVLGCNSNDQTPFTNRLVDTFSFEVPREVPGSGVPEPSSLALITTGVLGLLGHAWRRRRT